MAESNNGSDGGSDGAASPASPARVQVVSQYIKDLSFENPHPDRMLDGPGEAPNLNVEVNVGARRAGADLFESAIDFKAHAANKAGTIYDLELVYAGLFRMQGLPEPAREPFLLVNCPTLLFPFLRRIVADISREGGFPPLLLDPIDFGALFAQRKQQELAKAGGAKPTI